MTLWESEENKDSEPVCLVHSHGPSALFMTFTGCAQWARLIPDARENVRSRSTIGLVLVEVIVEWQRQKKNCHTNKSKIKW